MADDYRPTHYLVLRVLSDAQQLYGTATSYSFPSCSPSCFCLCLSVLPRCHCPTLQPLCLLSPRHPSFILHPFVAICLPASRLLQLLLPSCSICLSLQPSLYLFAVVLFYVSCVFFLSRCSGPTDSTSLITRARAALNSSSRPKSWKRSGWSSLAWPCKCVLSLCACVWIHAWQCDQSVCLFASAAFRHIAHPVIQVR